MAIRASERGVIFEKNIPGNGGMIYLMLMPSFILVPSGLGNTFSHSQNIRTYYILNQQKLCIYAYYDIRNLIETRGRGVKTIALPLDR